MESPMSGIVWEGLVGVALLVQVCPCRGSVPLEWVLRFPSTMVADVSLCQLPVYQNAKISATVSVPQLSASHHKDDGLTLENYMEVTNQMFSFVRLSLAMVSLQSNETQTIITKTMNEKDLQFTQKLHIFLSDDKNKYVY